MDNKQQSLFGWSSILSNYSGKDFFEDVIIPLIISLVLYGIARWRDVDSYVLITTMVDLGVSIIPGIVGLIVAAYTILLSFIASEKMKGIVEKDVGAEFVKSINSSFAICLFASIFAIVFFAFVKCICSMGIEIYESCAELVNTFVFIFSSFLLFFSIFTLFGIMMDIYNSGQTTLTK